MVLASGTRVKTGYITEVTRGTTPGSPTLKELRATTRNINLQKNILETQEVRASRQKSDARHGFNQVVGSYGFELALQDYDDIIEYAMSGTWAAGTTATTIGTDATGTGTSKFTRASGSFITDGFRVGDIVQGAGFTDPDINLPYPVISVSALEIVVYDPGDVISTEAAGGGKSVTLVGKRVDIGTTLRTGSFERQFLDVAQYQLFRGVAVNQFSLNITPEAIVGGTFDLLGMSAAAMSGSSVSGGAPTAPQRTSPFAAFDGAIFEAGALIAVVTGLTLALNNNRRLEAVVGAKFSPDVFEGQAEVSGEVTAFFENATLFNKFVNETESTIMVKLAELGTSGFMALNIPRVKYMGGDMDPPQEGPITLRMPFRGLEHATYGTALTVQRSNS